MSARQRVFGLLAVSCFLLQQVLAPLHCFLHSHELQGASQQEHAAAHCLDMHGLEHQHEETDSGHDSDHRAEQTELAADDHHEPHPVEDHLSRKVERMVLRSVYKTPNLGLSEEPNTWRPILTGGHRLVAPMLALQSRTKLPLPPQRGPPA